MLDVYLVVETICTQTGKFFRFCSTYPNYWIIPLTISDLEVEQVGLYRALRRVPAVVWRYKIFAKFSFSRYQYRNRMLSFLSRGMNKNDVRIGAG